MSRPRPQPLSRVARVLSAFSAALLLGAASACGGSEQPAKTVAPPTYLELAALLDSHLTANDLALDAGRKEAYVVHLAKQDPRSVEDAEDAIRAFLSPPTRALLAELVGTFATNAVLAFDDATQKSLVDHLARRSPRTIHVAIEELRDVIEGRTIALDDAGNPIFGRRGVEEFEVFDHNETDGD